MRIRICCLLLTVLAPLLLQAEALELRYEGTLAPTKRGESGEPVKNFSLYLLDEQTADSPPLPASHFFIVEERGSGNCPWPERFGRTATPTANNEPTSEGARILLRFGTDDYYVPLPAFHFADQLADQLADDAKWSDNGMTYKVVGATTIDDRDCWQVLAVDQVGRQHTWAIDKQNNQLVAASKTITVGRGDNFHLQLKLTSQADIDETTHQQAKKSIDILLKLQKDMDRKADQTENELTSGQLALVADVVEDLKTAAVTQPYQQLAEIISRDLKSQQQRETDVTQLAGQFKNKPAPKFQLKTIAGEMIDPRQQHPENTIVLHFWGYRDTPLREPYGQIGYLDFLFNKHKADGVQVFGVAVNPRLDDPAQADAAVRSVRKLREFMNLSYPITLDSGALLKQFGDPRRVDGQLPLWIVISADGKIVEYHAGNYDINPVEGLKHLDLLIRRLEKKKQQPNSE